RAWFDLDRVEEIALDPRAYDFDHPVNRRPNYHFGQWDPHQISNQGYFSRFVLQQMTLDALLTRYDGCSGRHGKHHAASREAAHGAAQGTAQGESGRTPDFDAGERLEEAAAVLAGTMLMAAGTSGDAPGRHD